MKRFLFFAAFVVLAFDGHAQAPAPPMRDAIPFRVGETIVRKGTVESVEFDRGKVNLTLKNQTDKTEPLEVRVFVLNKDGITLWQAVAGKEYDTLEPGEKTIKSFDFQPGLPESLQFIVGASRLDLSPRWIYFYEKPKPKTLLDE